jgi:hypothetical protein
MSKRVLEIKINCGDKTCASKPGKFCRFAGAKGFGTRPVCLLFRDNDSNEVHLTEEIAGGWLARCSQCLRAERKEKP